MSQGCPKGHPHNFLQNMNLNKKTYRLAFSFYLLDQIKGVNKPFTANKIDEYHKNVLKLEKSQRVSGRHIMRLLENKWLEKIIDDKLLVLGNIYGGNITNPDIFENRYITNKSDKVLAQYVQQAIEYFSPKPKNHSSRDHSSFLGIWRGHSKEKKYVKENNEYAENKEYEKYEISFEMNAKKTSEVIGTIEIFYHDHPIKSHQHQTFTFSGKVISNSLLFIEYKNVKSSAFHFGSILFKLNAIGDTLTGAFVGYGITAEQIVHGEVTVSKALSTHS